MIKPIPIIIVNFGRSEILKRSLTYFRESMLGEQLAYRLIIVDNQSQDTTWKVMAEFRDLISDLIVLRDNKGKPWAWNVGIAHCYQLCMALGEELPDRFVLCDSDLEYYKNWLGRMDETYNAFADLPLGILSGFLTEVGQHKVQKAERGDQAMQIRRYPPGCCWMMSRKCLETVGLFDTRILIRSVDTSYCRRVWQAGFKNGVVAPGTVVQHLGEGSRTWDLVTGKTIYIK